jgi:2-dehydro-3-deoxygluconokinase
MAALTLKPADSCTFDQISLGEIMLRLDPGAGRIRTARQFRVWEGGGEYNVARGLRRCFGLRTAVCTAFVDNDVGRLLEDFVLQGGVDTRFLRWLPFDGVGRAARNALNFTERGFSVRGAVGISDRGHSAASQLGPGAFPWDEIFGKLGVRWLHTGGIFAALSESTSALVLEAVAKAKQHGVVVSYDLNYRPSLWKSIGGKVRAQAVNQEIARSVDVMLGNEEDFTACLGLAVEGADDDLLRIDVAAFRKMIAAAVAAYPNLKVVATTLRAAKTATRNDWGAICWMDGTYFQSRSYPDLEIRDRVGGGDSFASGLIYGLLTESGGQRAVDLGAAHGALAMTTEGDTSMATLAEVEKLVKGSGARVQR